MPKAAKFRSSKIGIRRMLAKCNTTVAVDLPAIFKQMFAIQKMRKKGTRRYTICFPSQKARDKFMADWKRTYQPKV